MKKYLFIVMALVLPLIFVSCSKDDDEPNYNSKVVGEWIEFEPFALSEVAHLSLKADGTGAQWFEDHGSPDDFMDTFVWNATNDVITIISKTHGSRKVTYAIKGNKLYFTYDGETLVFVRK